MAQAYPRTAVVGSDYHGESIELARKNAAEAGVSDRVTFEVATAQTFSGTGYDLVTTFDALHDMGDPVGAARQIHERARSRRHVAARRALRLGPGRGEPQPGGPALLRRLDVPLRAQRALPGRGFTHWVRRPVRPRSGRWWPRPASATSGEPRRHRSTSSTRSGRRGCGGGRGCTAAAGAQRARKCTPIQSHARRTTALPEAVRMAALSDAARRRRAESAAGADLERQPSDDQAHHADDAQPWCRS